MRDVKMVKKQVVAEEEMAEEEEMDLRNNKSNPKTSDSKGHNKRNRMQRSGNKKLHRTRNCSGSSASKMHGFVSSARFKTPM